MSDDPNKTAPQDAQRVNVNQEHELRYWSEKFGTSPEELTRIVARVGVMADDVERAVKSGSKVTG